MSKFISHLASKKEKFLISLLIQSIDYQVQDEPIEGCYLKWKRGDQNERGDRFFTISPYQGKVSVNQMF
jgi:hypothetical protein